MLFSSRYVTLIRLSTFIGRVATSIAIRGLLTVFLGTPIAFAAPIQEAWQPQTPSSVYEYATTHFDLSDTQSNKLLLYEEVLKRGLTLTDYFKLARITYCESRWTHERNGELLVSRTGDKGFMQINENAHREAMLGGGYDISDLRQNVAYGVILYDSEGVQPWVCAKLLGIR